MSNPIKVELTLDLDKHIHSGWRQTSEDDYAPIETTLETLVLDLAARKVADMSTRDRELTTEIRSRVAQLRDDEIRAHVRPLIEEALTRSLQRTNSFGEPAGEETTLRDLILAEVGAEVKRLASVKTDRYAARSDARTPLQEMIEKEVGAAFAKDVRAELDKAKAEILAAVRAKGAAVLAQTVQDLADKL